MRSLCVILALSSCLTWTSAASVPRRPHEKRVDTSLGQIYAFGGNMSGTPVFFSNSKAYIGHLELTGYNGTYATFTRDNDTHLIASPTDSSSWSASYFAINDTAGAQDAAALVEDPDSTGLSTIGFLHYGTLIAWLSLSNILELNWFAQSTEVDGIWSLNWAADGWTSDIEDSFAVVLRTSPTSVL